MELITLLAMGAMTFILALTSFIFSTIALIRVSSKKEPTQEPVSIMTPMELSELASNLFDDDGLSTNGFRASKSNPEDLV